MDLEFKYGRMLDAKPFVPAPEPDVGKPRKPEMDGVTRIELRDGTGGKTGHIAFSVATPNGDIGILPGELICKDEDGNWHVLTAHKSGGWAEKVIGAGPYFEVQAPAPKAAKSK